MHICKTSCKFLHQNPPCFISLFAYCIAKQLKHDISVSIVSVFPLVFLTFFLFWFKSASFISFLSQSCIYSCYLYSFTFYLFFFYFITWFYPPLFDWCIFVHSNFLSTALVIMGAGPGFKHIFFLIVFS